MNAPYRNDGLNEAFRRGRADARAARAPKSTRNMSTFFAIAHLRGYRGQAGHRESGGHLTFTVSGGGHADRRIFGGLGVRRAARPPLRYICS